MKLTAFAIVSLALVIAVGAGVAHADDRAEAFRHFQAAQTAEDRGDFARAVSEYELAYDAAPDPSVLFNLGNAYERMGNARQAALYFERYLDDSPEADDRDHVEQRIAALQARAAKVTVTSTPVGAAIFIDGRRSGEAPLTLSLAAGPHELYAAAGGKTTPVRAIKVAYGEPLAIAFELRASNGWLIVDAGLDGAEVAIDGVTVGETPFRGAVPAGDHVLLVSKPGYASVERHANVPAEGSAQVSVSMMLLGDGGSGDGGGPSDGGVAVIDPATISARRFLVELEYGYDPRDASARYLFGIGSRAANRTSDLLLVAGFAHGGPTVGGVLRLFPAQGRLFAETMVAVGAPSNRSGDERFTIVQGALGFRLGSQGSSGPLSLDYYLSVGAGAVFGEPDGPTFLVPISIGTVFGFRR